MNLNNLKYPVILINSKEPVPTYARNLNELTSCSYSAIKKKYFTGLDVIDCEGKNIKIIEALPLRPLGLFGFLKRNIKVELILSNYIEVKPNIVSLEKFKEKILNFLKQSNSLYQSGDNHNALISFVENEKTIENIIKRMTEEYYQEI